MALDPGHRSPPDGRGLPSHRLPMPDGGFLLTKLEALLNWARANSLWPLTFGTSCCAIEMMSTGASRHDWSRFGFEVARATPRQADMIVVAGTICFKMATRLRVLYQQMPEPKWVLAMGACATSGGPFYYDSYSVVKGVDKVIPVDVYLPGCPPRPEGLLDALMKLQEKIKQESATASRPLPDFPFDHQAMDPAEVLREMTSASTPINGESQHSAVAPLEAIKAETVRVLGPRAQYVGEGKLAVFRVQSSELHESCRLMRQAGFDYLILVTAVDYPAEKRFELDYVLSNFTDGREVCLVTDVERENPRIETVSDLWVTAEWHEREVFDLFGIRFEGHPDLRRILLDDAWAGHPLRKDYVDTVHNVIKRPY